MIHKVNEPVASEGYLLTPQEQVICKQVAAHRQAPHSQRALALLALNENSTQAQAAEQAGLTRGQVKYCVARFRKLRLSIFPDALLAKPAAELEEEPQSAAPEAISAGKSPKTAKAKKGKKAGKKAKQAKDKTKDKTKDKKENKKKKSKKKAGKAKKKNN